MDNSVGQVYPPWISQCTALSLVGTKPPAEVPGVRPIRSIIINVFNLRAADISMLITLLHLQLYNTESYGKEAYSK